MRRQGFTLIEMLMTLGGIFLLIILAGQFWNGQGASFKEQAYIHSLEDVIARSVSYAQKSEQPVAICFTLNEGCGAEGALTPVGTHANQQNIQEWQLIEALPMQDNVSLRTNLPDNRLMIHAGGLNVQQPGTIYICTMNQELPYVWRITVSRAAKVTSKKIEGEQSLEACS